MDYLKAQRFIKEHVCGECNSELSYRYKPDGTPVIICPSNPAHKTFERTKSPSEIWRQGGQLPLEIANQIEKKEGKSMETKMLSTRVVAPAEREIITKHLQTFQADLASAEIERAVALVGMGFTPYFHLAVYQKRVMVTCDGMHWWKNQAPQKCRIVTEIIKGEDREAYGLAENEVGVIANLYREGESEPAFTGFGRASKDMDHPVMRGSFVEHEHPYRMAEKRAEIQVIRKFHPIGVEVIEEVMVDDADSTSESTATECVESADVEVEDASARAETELLPPSDEGQRATAWQIIKEQLNSLKVTNEQLATWSRGSFGIYMCLDDFKMEEPPTKFTTKMLSALVDSLEQYKQRQKEKQASG